MSKRRVFQQKLSIGKIKKSPRWLGDLYTIQVIKVMWQVLFPSKDPDHQYEEHLLHYAYSYPRCECKFE